VPKPATTRIEDIVDTFHVARRVILDGILAGQANKVIAYDLRTSVKSVETHRHRIMAKFGAGSLAELVRRCLLAGIGASAIAPPSN